MAAPRPSRSLDRARPSGAWLSVARLARRSVAARRTRLALTAAAVALAVGFVGASLTFTAAMSDAYTRLASIGTTDAELIVRSDAGFGFLPTPVPDEVAVEVAGIEGVAAVTPIVQGWARLAATGSAGSADPTSLGIASSSIGLSFPPPGSPFGSIGIVSGRAPATNGEVAIDTGTARRLALSPGAPIDVIALDGTEPFRVVGTVEVAGGVLPAGTTVSFFDLDTARRVLGSDDGSSFLAVTTEEGADPTEVRDRIAAALPSGSEVVTASAELQDRIGRVERALSFVESLATAVAAAVLLAAAFLIHTTFRVLVIERTRELSLLRLAGATGSQVMALVAAEAAMLGAAASVVGLAAAPGLVVLAGAAADTLGVARPDLALLPSLRTVAVGLAVGIVVTVGSALPPARRAARTRPLATAHEPERGASALRHIRPVAGALTTAAGMVLLGAGALRGDDALALAGAGAAACFVGATLLVPPIAGRFMRGAGTLVPRAAGVEGLLAPRSAIRRIGPTAAAASALMVGVTLVGTLAVLSASAKSGIRTTVSDEVAADFQIHAGLLAIPSITGVSPELVADLREIPEVGTIATMRLGLWRIPDEDRNRAVLGLDTAVGELMNLRAVAGEFADLGPGTVMLRADFAADRGLAVDDPFPMRFPSGAVADLRVAYLHDSDSIQIPVAVAMDTFDRHYTDRLEYVVLLDAAPGVASDRVRSVLEPLVAEYPGTLLTDREEYSATLGQSVDAVLGVLTALVGLAMLVALLGIVNTLVLSVHQRRREIGVLRAVGMTRRQVRRMIRWEAVLIGVCGALLGLALALAVGIGLAAAIGRGMRPAVPGLLLAGYLVAAVAGAAGAASWPAARAARIDVLTAIGAE